MTVKIAKAKYLSILLVAFAVPEARAVEAAQEGVWTTSTFLDFVDGKFSDGGVNTYISIDGTIRLINLWDLNNDGNFDLPVSCAQDYTETPNLFVYWADQEGFAADRRTGLPTEGAVGGTAADLNSDGYLDLVVCNRFDGEKNCLDSYIYWGSDKGFHSDCRSLLPTKAANAAATADLNRDGHPDIVFANGGADYHMTVDRFQKSFIYWGASDGYSASRRSTLRTVHASDVEIGDLNGDGYPDIVFANEGNCERESGAVVYFGDKTGAYSGDRSVFLPGIYSSDVAVADLNGDAHLDIVLANKHRLKGKREPPTGDIVQTHAVNSYVYWGSRDGYSPQRKTQLPTVAASACAIGDLNNDGLPDIVFANGENYLAHGLDHDVSLIYWNTPQGFFPNKRTQIVTPSAQDCVIDDLNGDGHLDVIFANYMKDGLLNIASQVYWGSPDGFDARCRSELPTQGARGIVVGDFNSDGRKDVVFLNKREGCFGAHPTTYWIYWGDQDGSFNVKRRQGLSAVGADSYLTVDMNEDKYVDLVYPGPHSTRVYWGAEEGFSAQNRSELLQVGPSSVARLADFNRDGYLDFFSARHDGRMQILYGQETGYSRHNSCVFDLEYDGYPGAADLNNDGWIDCVAPVEHKGIMVIYWNASTGFDEQRTTVLPVPYPVAPNFADLNGDGHLDLVIANQGDPNKRVAPAEKAIYHMNPHSDVYIYWGGAEGYSASRLQKLPSVGSLALTIADFNRDGRLDIAVANYHAGSHRQEPTYVYFNSPKGFYPENRRLIPADSGCGIFSADVNLDGYRELIIANHTRVGDHRAYVSVYYGSSGPYSTDRRTLLPATGPHFFTFCDVGNIYDRSDRYDYISPPFDGGRPVKLSRVLWQAETPFRTGIELQVRTAATRRQLASSPWTGPDGANSYYRVSGAKPKRPGSAHRWLQYKASLISPNSANTPLLKSVSIEFE